MVRTSLDDKFKDFDERFEKTEQNIKKTGKAIFIGAGTGFVLGAVGGVFLGESLNDYVEFLSNSPKSIQYVLDTGCALLLGGLGASGGVFLFGARRMYRTFRDF